MANSLFCAEAGFVWGIVLRSIAACSPNNRPALNLRSPKNYVDYSVSIIQQQQTRTII